MIKSKKFSVSAGLVIALIVLANKDPQTISSFEHNELKTDQKTCMTEGCIGKEIFLKITVSFFLLIF